MIHVKYLACRRFKSSHLVQDIPPEYNGANTVKVFDLGRNGGQPTKTYLKMPSVQTALLINAPPEKVWSTLADISHWPEWNTCFTDMQVHGSSKAPGIGTTITFATRIADPQKPGTSNARITHWIPGSELTWVGGALPRWLEWLVYGEHWFRVEEEGGTRMAER